MGRLVYPIAPIGVMLFELCCTEFTGPVRRCAGAILKNGGAQRQQFIDLTIQGDCRAGWLPYFFGGLVDWDMTGYISTS